MCVILRLLLAILLPPLGVLSVTGCQCTQTLLINILLTIIGYIPGIIHAIWVVCCRDPGN
uniref:Plasma membrane proteolipid 3 n=1 Tax=Plectus sambesii TaxID=2011161 RepID=A0A914XII9_9BILA